MSGFDDPFWTPEQVIAWIAFRDRALVDATSATEIRKLRAKDKNGYIKINQTPLGKHINSHLPGSEVKRKYFGAVDKLRAALQTGQIVASHRPKGSARRAELSKLHWVDHRIGYNYHGVLCSELPGKVSFNDDEVRFDAECIKNRWPIQNNYVQARRSAGERAYDKLRGMMDASPNERTTTKGKVLKQLMQEIPGLSERAAKLQWARAVMDASATAWTRRGRPAKAR